MKLRDVVLDNYAEISVETLRKVRPDGAQLVDGKWYVPKWGCDTIAHTLDALLSTADSEQRAAFVAGYDAGVGDGRGMREVYAADEKADSYIATLTRPGEQREVADLRRKMEIAEAEKKQKQMVIDNLKSDVLTAVCGERDDALRKLATLETGGPK